jgi:hypothetical protein
VSVKPISLRTLVSRKNPSINKNAISGPSRPNFQTTNELRQEIETLRAMIETVASNKDWSSEERRAIRTTAQRIAERVKGIS